VNQVDSWVLTRSIHYTDAGLGRETAFHHPQALENATMSLDPKLLNLLVCPLCKGDLTYDKTASELICRIDQVAYPVRDDIPVMLPEEARTLSEQVTIEEDRE
jgi:uncharacterized protein YbaR (Trm112 family)